MSRGLALPLLALAAGRATTADAHATASAAAPSIWGWEPHPVVLLLLVVFAAVYWRGATRLLRASVRGHAARVRECLLFGCGHAFVVIALVGPVDALGERLFSAHMAQHMILMIVAAPLLTLAHPLPALLLGLPAGLRRGILSAWAGSRVPAALWRVSSAPTGATFIQLAVLYLWHEPAMFRAAVESEAVHAAMHASFLLAALLFWWSMLRATKIRSETPVALLGQIVTLKLTGILGLIFILGSPLYSDLYPHAAMWGLTVAEDQQVAGIVMMGAGLPVYFGSAMVLLAVWLARAELQSAS